jgi:hypothetical protein
VGRGLASTLAHLKSSGTLDTHKSISGRTNDKKKGRLATAWDESDIPQVCAGLASRRLNEPLHPSVDARCTGCVKGKQRNRKQRNRCALSGPLCDEVRREHATAASTTRIHRPRPLSVQPLGLADAISQIAAATRIVAVWDQNGTDLYCWEAHLYCGFWPI